MPTAASMESYYERRSGEYDDWYRGTGLFADRHRPGWEAELATVVDTIHALRPCRTLDVACGTGFVTRQLPGGVVGLDASRSMLQEARGRLAGPLVNADALALPFANASFERIFTGHFYGHLDRGSREVFLAEAGRVARELVVLDAALRRGVEPDQVQERILKDGSTHRVYKRFLAPDQLIAELGGGDVLCAGRWFVLVRSQR
jgi:demethylmenaquinone methyltransferase/2-methoxy-6-polyprenyl-1,4-benzoquinol methylase